MSEIGGRNLAEKYGKRLFAAVGLDKRKMMAWMAATGARMCWSSPKVLAVVGVGEGREVERVKSDRERNGCGIGNRRCFLEGTNVLDASYLHRLSFAACWRFMCTPFILRR